MEKSTVSALIIAGGTMVGGIVQALALRAAKQKRAAREAETSGKKRVDGDRSREADSRADGREAGS